MQLFFLLLRATGPVANRSAFAYLKTIGADANGGVGVLAFAKSAGGIFGKSHLIAKIGIATPLFFIFKGAIRTFFVVIVTIKFIGVASPAFANRILTFATAFSCQRVIIITSSCRVGLAQLPA